DDVDFGGIAAEVALDDAERPGVRPFHRLHAGKSFGDPAVVEVDVLSSRADAAASADLEAPARAVSRGSVEPERLQAQSVFVRQAAKRVQRVAARAEQAVHVRQGFTANLLGRREA